MTPTPHSPIPSPPHLRHLFALLLLGLLFRLAHLDQKIFWVDEVATVVRAVGYTKAEITAQLADGQIHRAADLLAYQRLDPSRSLADSLTALSRSPEHAPLYFLLTRFWMTAFGSSVAAIRSLSVLCSLLALPAIGWLCRELFGPELFGPGLFGPELFGPENSVSQRVQGLAMALLAVSPYFVAYAQEARPYSLWLLTILLCWASLLGALRRNSVPSWTLYVLSLALSLYTSLLSVLLMAGQVLYVGVFQKPLKQTRSRFGLAIGAALVAFSPWIWIILHQQRALEANTTWMRTAMQPLAMLAIWLYSLAVVWFDVPVVAKGWVAIAQAGIAALVLGVIAYAIYYLSCFWPRQGVMLAALGLPIPLVLVLLDLLLQGQASATPRYLIPTQLAALIAVAILCHPALPGPQRLSPHLSLRSAKPSPRTAQIILSGLLALSLVSNVVNLNRSPDYQKARNQANPAIAALINQAQFPRPVLLAEPSQTMDLLSLSHSLIPTVPVRIAPPNRLLDTPVEQDLGNQTCPALLFNPSAALLSAASRRGFQTVQLYRPALLTAADIHLSLWRLDCS